MRDKESARQKTYDSLQRNGLLSTLKQWRGTRRFFMGERGAWSSRSAWQLHAAMSCHHFPLPPSSPPSSHPPHLTPLPSARSPEAYCWKLDPTENFSRMRLRLLRNYNFSTHADASHLRDIGSAPDLAAEKISADTALLSLVKVSSRNAYVNQN